MLEKVVTDVLHIDDDAEAPPRRSCCKAATGMFNWFKVLWNLTDEKLLELNGADYTLDLVFLRQTAKFFAVVSIYNAIFMIPMFVSGEPAPNLPLQATIMNTITVINVTDKNGKMMFTYFSSILLMSGFGFALIL